VTNDLNYGMADDFSTLMVGGGGEKVQHHIIANSGGWSPNWVHSAPRPFTVLLCLPWVIVRMENCSVE
jgi:hypothetical protein